MFGISLSSLFRSRWMALAWAVLICLSAIQFVDDRTPPNDAPVSAGDTAQALDGAIDAMN